MQKMKKHKQQQSRAALKPGTQQGTSRAGRAGRAEERESLVPYNGDAPDLDLLWANLLVPET